MAEIELSRKDREKLRHKKEIMAIALKLFADEGFHNVSMHDIASKSEFAVGTLYNFFENKEHLFAALLDECGEKILKEIMPILESERREDERLREFIRIHSQLLEENIEVIKLYFSEYGTLSAGPSSSAENLRLIISKKLEDIIGSGIRKKIFRSVEPEVAMDALRSTLQSLAFKYSSHFDKIKLQKNLAEVERLFIDGLLSPKGCSND